MKKILVLGAGLVGAPMAYDLSKDNNLKKNQIFFQGLIYYLGMGPGQKYCKVGPVIKKNPDSNFLSSEFLLHSPSIDSEKKQ